jgi:hypothetical protein
MNYPQRISTCPTIPDLLGRAADEWAAAWSRTLPLDVWCRPSTQLALRGYQHAGSGRQSSRPWEGPTLSLGSSTAIRACFHAATGMLLAARLLQCGDMLRPSGAAVVLHRSSLLTERGMKLWRRGRSHRRR